MKKVITIMSMFVIATFAFSQTQSGTQAAVKTAGINQAASTAKDSETQTTVENFTSIGNNWVGAGMGFAWQTDTGILGYAEGQYNVYNLNEFNVDLRALAEYTDMSSQTFNLGIDVLPSYKFYNYKGVDMAVFATAGVGYGTVWYDSDGYSMISYKIGAGLEFSYDSVYLRPFYNWVNYDPFNGYSTIRNHVVGIEAGGNVDTNWVVVVSYSHWFAETEYNIKDNEDRMTFGVRYLF